MNRVSPENKRFFDELIEGDALSEPFPRADVILSQYALGCIGHPDFMLRKVAEALLPGGEAFLHLNTHEKRGFGKLIMKEHHYENLLHKVSTGKLGLKGVEVKFVRAEEIYSRDELSKRRVRAKDIFIYMRKLSE